MLEAQNIAVAISPQARKNRKGWYQVRGVCHGGDSEPPKGGKLGIRDSDQGIAVKCWVGCERRQIIDAIERTTRLLIRGQNGKDLGRSLRSESHSRRQEQTARKGKSKPTRSVTIPMSPEHPARLWVADRNLWPGRPAITAYRSLDASGYLQTVKHGGEHSSPVFARRGVVEGLAGPARGSRCPTRERRSSGSTCT